jgi:hypothetical protein
MRVVRMHAYADLDAEEGRVYVNALKRMLRMRYACSAYADLDAEEGRVYVNALKRKLLLHRALVSHH